jgi:hypothetical protein
LTVSKPTFEKSVELQKDIMKEAGASGQANHMALELSFMKMEVFIRGSGKTVSKTVLGEKSILIPLYTLESVKTKSIMDGGSLNGQRELLMMEYG